MSEEEKSQWYSNKELFEQITGMKDEFNELRSEMRETRSLMKQYNGLRERIGQLEQKNDDVSKELSDMKAKKSGKQAFIDGIGKYGGWLFGVAGIVATYISLFN